jgi:NAD(P)H dehydrogenase (quinone)
MIVVTGATGQLGRAIVERLIERVPPSLVGVSVRNPEKSADLTQKGVCVRSADFAEPASLASAFEGASQVLIISSNARRHGGDTLTQHRAAIDAARAAGARRVVCGKLNESRAGFEANLRYPALGQLLDLKGKCGGLRDVLLALVPHGCSL